MTYHAVAELRAADLGWAQEEDDLPSAGAELRGDPTPALACRRGRHPARPSRGRPPPAPGQAGAAG
ncbi:hypothetical protein AB0B63_10170 [Micromonospora sp. NPDC049081]|uniref:hypothetical protein n=1 Tax=Micromonospora sp. NPDC049081 TaxID=3155150 RepID=UPI0033ECFB3D